MPNKPLYHSILLIKAFLTSQGEKGEPGLVPVVSIHMSVLFPCAFSKVSYSVVVFLVYTLPLKEGKLVIL